MGCQGGNRLELAEDTVSVLFELTGLIVKETGRLRPPVAIDQRSLYLDALAQRV